MADYIGTASGSDIDKITGLKSYASEIDTVVGSVKNDVRDDYMVYKESSGKIVGAPIKMVKGQPVFEADPIFNSGALEFGAQTTLTSVGSLLGLKSNVSGDTYVNLLQKFTRDDFGSALYIEKDVAESGDKQVLHADYSTEIASPFNFDVSSATYDINTKLYFRTSGNISDFKFTITSATTGKVMYYFPSQLAWTGDYSGLSLTGSGEHEIDLFENNDKRIAPILLIPGSYTINVKYQGSGKLLGSSTGDPYYAADIVVFKQKPLATKDELDILQKEVDRIKTYNPAVPADKIYTFRDKGIPTSIPAGFKEYYIHSILLRDDLGTIRLPATAAEDTIFVVENNDRNNYLTLYPPTNETINGSRSAYRCNFDTLSYFVKSGQDWVLAFGGVFS